jgi:DNA-directed RNA polymerase subunit M/transcription elongation factor TFIIS
MATENPLAIDVATRTTRGRPCPRCGGKIIPSDRAVYQNSSDPDAVFPVWQCERCGYEELAARPKSAASKAAAPKSSAIAKPESAKQVKAPATAASLSSASSAQMLARPKAAVVLDPKGRPYPPDVLQLMDRMKQPVRRDE